MVSEGSIMRKKVAIVMGSDSDWDVMCGAAEALEELGVSFDCQVVSAHRSPKKMIQFGEKAHLSGFRVLIAGAGGAAHLPGMLASVTPLPVIGVPVCLKELEGLDSLLSIAQMPRGIPVATVAINNSYNAGLLAGRILGLRSSRISGSLKIQQKDLKRRVQEMNTRLMNILKKYRY